MAGDPWAGFRGVGVRVREPDPNSASDAPPPRPGGLTRPSGPPAKPERIENPGPQWWRGEVAARGDRLAGIAPANVSAVDPDPRRPTTRRALPGPGGAGK
jgi:hypothetical protein